VELFHTPDTMPDAPNMGSNTRSKPAGLGNQVRELHEQGLLPLFDEDLLPTPTTGYSGRDPVKWRDERKPSTVGNVRKITDLQVALVELEGDLPVLPTPSAVDGSGGSMQQSLDSLRHRKRQVHLTDLPRMLELEAEDLPLLRTPQAQVTEAKPGIKLEGRTPSDPQVGLADQVLADFHGPLLPTPVVNDMGAGKTPEQWDQWTDDLRARGYGNGNGHGNSLSVEVIRAEGEALLPTPQTRDATGGKPEAVHRGRGYGADLNDVAAAGLLDQAPLLPTPCAVDRLADGNMTLDQWDESRRSQKERGVGSFGPRGDSLGAAVLRVHEGTVDERPDFSTTRARTAPEPLLPTPMARDHRPASPAEALRNSPGLSSIGALLPTPAARDATGGVPSRLDRTQGAFLNDVAAAGLLPGPEKVKLLPTPTTLDHVEKRTTHAGGNPTLQGAVCGTNPVDAERLGVKSDGPLLPTPQAFDSVDFVRTPEQLAEVRSRTGRSARGNGNLRETVVNELPLLPTPNANIGGGRQHTERGTTNGVTLAEALREIPLMPTPQATDHMCGSTTLQGRIDSNRQVMLPHVVRDLPLLPTPKAHDGVFGTPRTTGRPIEKSTHLQTIVSLMGLPDGAPLLPTPTSSDGSGGGVRTNLTWEGTTRSTGDGGNSRLRDVVGLFGLDEALPMLPTPRLADHKGTDSASERSRNTPGLGAISIYYDTSLDDGQDDSTDLMPTPQARDWKGAPGRNYKNRNLARDMERLAAGAAAPDDGPGPETVVNQHGEEQFTLFPTPNVGAREVRNSPSEMARRTPALGAVVADLAELGDASRFHGTPLLPTPNTINRSSRRAMLGIADPEGNCRHWTGPGLEQVMEMLDGSLPREFDTADEIPGSYREDLLPTPMTVNRTSRRAQTGRPTSGPSRGGPSYGLEDVVTDLDPATDYVLPIQTEKETLMPTPKSYQRGDCPSERERDSPDLGATTLHFPAGRWGKYGPAVERWEKLTRPAPAPTEPNKNGNPRLTARFSEWLLGWPEGWVTDPEIGIARTGQLRLIGNGVVPQQAATALVMLLRDEADERKQATYGE